MITITWEKVMKSIASLAMKIYPVKDDYINIYAIPRGGLIPGVILSHELGLPMITNAAQITEKTLVVDDICDTGETLYNLKLDNDVAVIYYHTQAAFMPKFIGETITGPEWFIFPWETEKSTKTSNV